MYFLKKDGENVLSDLFDCWSTYLLKHFSNLICIYCVCVRCITLCNCLCSFSSCFSTSRVREFRIVNWNSWFWTSLNMVNGDVAFSIFRIIHVRTDIRIDISFPIKLMTHQNWQAGTSGGVDTNETNEAGSGDITTPRSCVKLKKLFAHYQRAYSDQTWQDGTLTLMGSCP